jgi:hypothetical protein
MAKPSDFANGRRVGRLEAEVHAAWTMLTRGISTRAHDLVVKRLLQQDKERKANTKGGMAREQRELAAALRKLKQTHGE